MYSAVDLSRFLIKKAYENKIYNPTLMWLQKMLYFSQGWYLHYTKKPLFAEDILLYSWGIGIKEIQTEFIYYGSSVISQIESKNLSVTTDIDHLLNQVIDVYGHYSDSVLSGMIAAGIWKNVYDPSHRLQILDISVLQDYFTDCFNEQGLY